MNEAPHIPSQMTLFEEDPSLRPRNLRIQSVNESEFGEEMLQKLKLLQAKKDESVENEDYDMAQALKGVTDSLKLMGSDLAQLEKRKA